MSDLKQNCVLKKIVVFPPGIEPMTLRLLGVRDNHYTTETLLVAWEVSSRYFSDKWREFGGRYKYNIAVAFTLNKIVFVTVEKLTLKLPSI